MRVLIADGLESSGVELLQKHAEVKLYKSIDRDTLLFEIADSDALIVRSATLVDAEVFRAAGRLKVVGRAGVGVNNIDVGEATTRGILVLNVPNCNTNAAAEHTIALMLALVRHIPDAWYALKAGEWNRSRFMGCELRGKTLGIVGLGRIGSEVARKAQAFSMRVLGCDPYVHPAASPPGVELVELGRLFSECDIITVHTPLTEHTKALIGKEQIQMMKDGVILVNCARGGIIDEQALAEALDSGKVGGAALDVFASEPPFPCELLSKKNIIATPHLGASTREAQEQNAISVARQVLSALAGEPVEGAVNMPSLDPEQLVKVKPLLPLADALGRFAGGASRQSFRSVEIGFHGECTENVKKVLWARCLAGVLAHVTEVNPVNAAEVARRRGIEVATRHMEEGPFKMSIALEGRESMRYFEMGLSSDGRVRVFRIDDYPVDFPVEGHLLVVPHRDKPGIIGRVGTQMGRESINIAGMQVGRLQKGGVAVMLMQVDEQVPRRLLEEIRNVDGIVDAHYINL